MRRDPREPELGDEAVLESIPQALDPALGLGAVGHDVVDPEGPQGLPDLRGLLVPLELFGERPVGIVTHEDAVGVRVDRGREPHGAPQREEEREVPRRILLGPEGGREDGPGGIVDGP